MSDKSRTFSPFAGSIVVLVTAETMLSLVFLVRLNGDEREASGKLYQRLASIGGAGEMNAKPSSGYWSPPFDEPQAHLCDEGVGNARIQQLHVATDSELGLIRRLWGAQKSFEVWRDEVIESSCLSEEERHRLRRLFV